MKNRDKKAYEKALHLYNNGYIDKALEVCEIGISRDLEDSNLLNLKGLLLYLKGNLEEAIPIWKINEHHNNNDIAKSYLKDVQKDFYRKDLYEKAEELINDLNIDEALKNLSICKESDFNSINVNNALATCYLRKAEYSLSMEYVEKVISIDKFNYKAKNIKKEINEILNINNKSLLKTLIIASIAVVFLTSGILLNNKFKKVQINKEELANNISKPVENESTNNEQNEENKDNEENKKSSILEVNSLTDEEIRENYIKATGLFQEEKYEEAKYLLEATIIHSMNNHLHDDVMFLLASTSEKVGKNEEAIKYFKDYISNYENGNYIEETYYRISLLYKDLDKEKSKLYAGELVSKYPSSIYNNNLIKDILSN
ncbi:hypothetical protein SDC9_53829 [bioreactor metagenome]|uniref:Outer membrane protein assembly factor BamD n=1 Tax=bioreactor metagenome TaxID=1076179 RepID=A0A644WZR4_9ZZZZ